jgi:nitroreductase
MGQDELYEAIFRRKSVREYAPGPLDADALAKISSFMTGLRPAFPGIRTELRIMTNAEVRGMFKVDAPHFLAIFSETKEGHMANAGFVLQQMDLFFSANGIGSCWQGGPKAVGKARSASDLEFVILMAFGRPAGDSHRKNALEFERKPLAKISDVKGYDDLLEPARLAPSGMNNQPWYFTGGNGTIHVHSAKSLVFRRMNLISAGIALSHLLLAAAHSRRTAEIVIDRSGEANPPKGYSYVASMMTG